MMQTLTKWFDRYYAMGLIGATVGLAAATARTGAWAQWTQ